MNYFPASKSIYRFTHGWQSSVCAENSVSPFGITEEILVKILQRYSIPVTFLDIILAFGQKPGNGVAGMAQAAFSQSSKMDFGQ